MRKGLQALTYLWGPAAANTIQIPYWLGRRVGPNRTQFLLKEMRQEGEASGLRSLLPGSPNMRVLPFTLGDAPSYGNLRDIRFVLLVCLCIAFSARRASVPDQLFMQPVAVCWSDIAYLVKRVFLQNVGSDPERELVQHRERELVFEQGSAVVACWLFRL